MARAVEVFCCFIVILDYVRCGVWTSCYLVVLELEAVYFRTGQQLIFGSTTVVPILETNKFGLLCPMRIKNQVAELPALHEMTYFTSEIYFLWRYEFLPYQSAYQADGSKRETWRQLEATAREQHRSRSQ